MSGQQGRNVVIVEAIRTPIGRGHPEKGYYRDVHPATLLGTVLIQVLKRAQVDPAEVGHVVAGCVQQFGQQSLNVGRTAWLQQGLPIETSATTIDLQCGSAQQAVGISAAMIAAGVHDVVIGSGVEHMGHNPFAAVEAISAEYGGPLTEEFLERHAVTNQGLAAEMMADHWDIAREELEELAVRSHRLAHEATVEGRFSSQLAETTVDGTTLVADQGIRPDTNADSLSGLKPAFKADGKITAATSSQISDGASAILLMSEEKAAELGVTPRAQILDQTSVGCDPVMMLEGPIPATRELLRRNEMTIGDIDLVEINEAFASVVAAWQRELGPDMDRVNVNGGAMALGHPLGASGARLITTLLHELERSDKELGLVTMCCGGGIGTGTLIRRV